MPLDTNGMVMALAALKKSSAVTSQEKSRALFVGAMGGGMTGFFVGESVRQAAESRADRTKTLGDLREANLAIEELERVARLFYESHSDTKQKEVTSLLKKTLGVTSPLVVEFLSDLLTDDA